MKILYSCVRKSLTRMRVLCSDEWLYSNRFTNLLSIMGVYLYQGISVKKLSYAIFVSLCVFSDNNWIPITQKLTFADLYSSSRTSDNVGCAWTANFMSCEVPKKHKWYSNTSMLDLSRLLIVSNEHSHTWTLVPNAIALDASCMRSAACIPKMWTPRISPVSVLYINCKGVSKKFHEKQKY